jgi:hypothetical protein
VGEAQHVRFFNHMLTTHSLGLRFMFRWVLHNWPDVHIQRIFRALIPSLKPGAKIIIFDEIMPPAGTMSLSVERNQRSVTRTFYTLPLDYC